MRIVLTGTTGYLGNALQRYLQLQGHNTQELMNDNGSPYRLGDKPDLELLRTCDLLIHLAWDRRQANGEGDSINLSGTTELIDACALFGTRFCFVSSYAVVFTPFTNYARQKSLLEHRVLESGGCCARIGLIWDAGFSGGPMKDFVLAVHRSFLIPLPIGRERFVHLAELDDVIGRLTELATQQTSDASIEHLSASTPVALRDLIRQIRANRFTVFVPLPLFLLMAGIRIARLLGWTTLSLDSAHGLLSSQATRADSLGSLSHILLEHHEDH